MKKRKSINNMNYDELQNRKSELVFEGFLGIFLLVALVLGVLLIVMIGDVSILNEDVLRDYISWFISAYGLIALGGLGIIRFKLAMHL